MKFKMIPNIVAIIAAVAFSSIIIDCNDTCLRNSDCSFNQVCVSGVCSGKEDAGSSVGEGGAGGKSLDSSSQTTTSNNNSSSSSGANNCDDSGDCDTCLRCSQSTDGLCVNVVTDCNNDLADDGCASLAQCMNGCLNAQCQTDCIEMHSENAQLLYGELYSCVICEACLNDCSGDTDPFCQ